jgi:hypothetical protein
MEGEVRGRKVAARAGRHGVGGTNGSPPPQRQRLDRVRRRGPRWKAQPGLISAARFERRSPACETRPGSSGAARVEKRGSGRPCPKQRARRPVRERAAGHSCPARVASGVLTGGSARRPDGLAANTKPDRVRTNHHDRRHRRRHRRGVAASRRRRSPNHVPDGSPDHPERPTFAAASSPQAARTAVAAVAHYAASAYQREWSRW